MTRSALLVLLATSLAISGCGAQHRNRASRDRKSGDGPTMRAAAVRLVLADLNARDDPRATNARTLRHLMAPYVARDALRKRVADNVGVIRSVRADGWKPPRLDSVTVGPWTTHTAGDAVMLTFVGYQTTTTRKMGTLRLPLERWQVWMRREAGAWKLVDYRQRWLSTTGPMGIPGDRVIDRLHAGHTVFRNR